MSYTSNQNQNLGAVSPFASQAASTAASAVANYAAASVTAGALAPLAFGSFAGPIGAIVGAIVTVLMKLFGGVKIKDPVFGLMAVIPEPEKVLTVGRLLDLLSKKMIYGAFGYGVAGGGPAMIEMGKTIRSQLDISPKGAFSVQSGGLPDTHGKVSSLDWNKLQTYTMNLAKPYNDTIVQFKPEIIQAILTTETPFKPSPSYYFWIGENAVTGVAVPGNVPGNLKWQTSGISENYNSILILYGKDLNRTMDKAFKRVVEEINKAWIVHTGMDIINGKVLDPEKLKAAVKPNPVQSITESITSPIGLLLGIGGLLLLRK